MLFSKFRFDESWQRHEVKHEVKDRHETNEGKGYCEVSFKCEVVFSSVIRGAEVGHVKAFQQEEGAIRVSTTVKAVVRLAS